MAITTEKVAETFLGVATSVDLNCLFPLFAEDEVDVIYGQDSLTAVLNTDYTVTLSTPNYSQFTITPLAPLLAKIDALIVADPEEINYVTVRRRLDYLTSVQPETVRYTAFLSREIDRIHMRLIQLNEGFARAITFPPKLIGDPDAPAYIPNVADRASQFLGFDALGNLITGLPSGEVLISAAMQSTVSAATLTAAFDILVGPFAPYNAVLDPSSGNIQGSGVDLIKQIPWTNTDTVWWANYRGLISKDPSALVVVTIGGTVTVGDVLTLNFTFGGHTYSASTTAVGGDTTTTLAAKLVLAVQANANLFAAANGTTNLRGGGSSKQITYITSTANAIQFDYDVRVLMTMSKSVTGAVTETITLPNAGNPLPRALDANPLDVMGRYIPGTAIPAGSNIGQKLFVGSQSNSVNSLSVQYGSISCDVISSTSGALEARLLFGTCHPVLGTIDHGFYLKQGLYTTLATGGDKGKDTVNANAYFTAGVNSRSLLPLQGPVDMTDAVGAVISATKLLSAVIIRTGTAAGFVDTTTTAALLVAAMNSPSVGAMNRITLINLTGQTQEIAAGAGFTLVGNKNGGGHFELAAAETRDFVVYVSSITGGAEAALLYG